jgi:Nif-specific regulatory protein
MSPRLVAVVGPFRGAAFPIAGPELSIGRDRSNAVCLDDLAVSRRHALIRRDGDQLRITDLGSHNRTAVNGVPIESRDLKHGDQIRIGHSVFVFALDTGLPAVDATTSLLADEPAPSEQTVVLGRNDARGFDPELIIGGGPRSDEAVRRLKCLLQVAETMGTVRGLDRLASSLLQVAATVIDADRGAILLTAAGAEEFARQVQWQRRDEGTPPLRVSRSIARQVLEEQVAICANDVHAGGAASPSVIASRARAVLAVPLAIAGRPLGVMYLDAIDPATRFDADDLQLLTGIAAMAAGGLDRAADLESVTEDNERLRAELNLEHDMVGSGPRMQAVYTFIAKVAPADCTVMIGGESGTGKELVARALHRNSPRAAKPFVAINCATLGESLLESELFGHEKGAFTGAIAQKRGKLEEAQGGTVFLDEIGELAPVPQAKLLRVLQERQFERVGGTRPIRADIRLVTATNRDLREEVARGRFRQDLYFRLNVVSIVLPPLRERREDIPELASHFLGLHARETTRRVTGCSKEALACLRGYDWPGNVRELEHAIERALVLGSSSVILPDDLPECVVESAGAEVVGAPRFHETIRRMKKQMVMNALDEAGGSYTEAAKLLGLHPNNLHRLMRTLHLKEART